MGLMELLQSPEGRGISQGLLASSASSRIPVSNGQAMANGIGGGMQMAHNEAALRHQRLANEMQRAQVGIYQNAMPGLLHMIGQYIQMQHPSNAPPVQQVPNAQTAPVQPLTISAPNYSTGNPFSDYAQSQMPQNNGAQAFPLSYAPLTINGG